MAWISRKIPRLHTQRLDRCWLKWEPAASAQTSDNRTQLKPSAPVHFLMGAVYYGTGQHKRAIQHLKQATHWIRFRRSPLPARPAMPGNELAPKSPGMFQDGSSPESEGNTATANASVAFPRTRPALTN